MIYLSYQGMWTGMMSGTVVQTSILAIITLRYNWEREVSFFFFFLPVLLVITDNRTCNSVVLVILFVGTECPNSC